MRPSLHPDYAIAIRGERAYIDRIRDRQPLAALSGQEALLLALMDGRLTWDALTGMLGEQGQSLLHNIRLRFLPLLVDGVRRVPDLSVNRLGCVAPPDPADGLRPIPGPRVLHWCVTRFCPRRCAYCYAEPVFGGRASDATLPRASLQQIFAEAASLGANLLLAGGSEPFLREDLPEVLGDAFAAGVFPNVTTKHPISARVARRLADAGIRHISLSVDTLDEAISHFLTGSGAYPNQVRESAHHLKDAGVAFSIQAVLVPQTLPSIDSLARFAVDAGAVVLQFSTFDAVREPIAALDNAAMALPKESAEEQVYELAKRYPGARIELFDTAGGEGYNCDIGMTKLFFLPDGTVHRCYKLTADIALRGANLQTASVAKAWHDPAFLPVLSPPIENYAGAGCSSCGRFSKCHDDGRCIYAAHVRHGRYTAPDRACDGPYPVPVPLVSIQPLA